VLLCVSHSIRRCPVCSAQAIPKGKVLSIIVVELTVVNDVVIRTIENNTIVSTSTIVNANGPEVDKRKQEQVQEFVHREHEHENVVWSRLQESVHWVKRVTSERSGDDPFVVKLVNRSIQDRVVKITVNPINERVSEYQVKDHLQASAEPIDGCNRQLIVELAVAI